MVNKVENGKSKYKVNISISLILFFLFFICFLYFREFSGESDLNNVYYIFSTSAQTLAALVGFVLTVYIFNHQNLRTTLENDESLVGIVDREIEKNYRIVSYLSIYTAFILISDLLMLQLNNVEGWVYKVPTYTVVALLNVGGILGTFSTALYILKPYSLEERARSILNEKSEDIEVEDESYVSRGEFIEKFIDLEKKVVAYTEERLKYKQMPNQQRRMPMNKRFELLYTDEKISRGTLNDLFEINKYRNLLVHGHIEKVGKSQFERLNHILNELEQKI